MNMHPTFTPLSPLLSCWNAALLLAILPIAAPAQTIQLAPQQARITDEAIEADQRAYETLQGRIKGLNEKGRPVRDYHLSKSQCWLDVSFHEYTRNDRSAFPQAAMTESEKLIVGMERGTTLGTDTPLVNGAARLRPDLWDRAAALHGHAGFRCAQQQVACAEVELVHAGNEHQQQAWRHAKPYVQIAEDLLGEAQERAGSCNPPPPAPPAPVPVPAPAPWPLPLAGLVAPVLPGAVALTASPPATVQELQLSAGVLFNFDQHDAANMRPYSVAQLEALVQRVQRERLVVKSIQLTGYADRLNSTGQADYNQRLSEKRVATVKAVLEKLGMAATLMRTAAGGDSLQVQPCQARYTRSSDLEACLLPNRRVEVTIEARRP
jgi:outer membrane protein OmpA-like peptidoglycan-associated protein